MLSSDLALSLSALSSARTKVTSDLFGYRGFLSFVAALDVKVIDVTELVALSYIGEGGYTEVHKAQLIDNPNTFVCVKASKEVLTQANVRAEAVRVQLVLASIIQELRISAHHILKCHPNIPKIIGVAFRQESFDTVRPLVVMELASGTLSSENHHLSWPERLRLCRDAADGIVALHSYGVVHGDIKGENVLLFTRSNGLVAAVSDMGGSGPEGTTDNIPGTRSFYAPECFRDSTLYSEHVNRTPRDVYSFGLLLCEVALNRPIFGGLDPQKQFKIQHRGGGIPFVKEQLSEASSELFSSAFCDIVYACLAFRPEDRPGMYDVSRRLSSHLCENLPVPENIFAANVVDPLLLDAVDPRVRYTSNISMNDALGAKLLSEYSLAAQETEDSRVALYMAAFYSGAYVPKLQLKYPYDALAKAQWQLKAIELGSLPTLSFDDEFMDIMEAVPSLILSFRDPSFRSPKFDVDRLFRRLHAMAAMPNERAVLLLEHLSAAVKKQGLDDDNAPPSDRKPYVGSSKNHFDNALTQRNIDLEVGDADAYDLLMTTKDPATRAAYNDDLGQLLTLQSPTGFTEKDKARYMEIAVHAGSLRVVRYLVLEMHVDVNGGDCDPEPMQSTVEGGKNALIEDDKYSWLDQAALLGRSALAEFLLDSGAKVTLHDGISALHLCPMKDQPNLPDILCRHLRKQGNLRDALEWRMGKGSYAGYTPLMVAATTRSWAVAAVFLDYGANPNPSISAGVPPILVSALIPIANVAPLTFVENLIKAGVYLDAARQDGTTALHMAVQSSNVSATFALLLSGACVTAENAEGKSALQEAEENAAEDLSICVFDEDGLQVENGAELCMEASAIVLRAVQLVSRKDEGWRECLQQELAEVREDVLRKMWVVGKGDLLQLTIPA